MARTVLIVLVVLALIGAAIAMFMPNRTIVTNMTSGGLETSDEQPSKHP